MRFAKAQFKRELEVLRKRSFDRLADEPPEFEIYTALLFTEFAECQTYLALDSRENSDWTIIHLKKAWELELQEAEARGDWQRVLQLEEFEEPDDDRILIRESMMEPSYASVAHTSFDPDLLSVASANPFPALSPVIRSVGASMYRDFVASGAPAEFELHAAFGNGLKPAVWRRKETK